MVSGIIELLPLASRGKGRDSIGLRKPNDGRDGYGAGAPDTISDRAFSTPRFLRSPKGWLGFLIFAAVAVACSGGDAAPDFELTLFETANHEAGETLRLSDLRGRPVVVNFWYPLCPPCRAEMPALEQAFQDHRDEGVEFVGVDQLILGTVEDGQDFVDEIGVTYALGADVEGDLIAEYGIVGFPTTVFIDRDGTIVRKWTGILTAEKIGELIGDLLD